MNHPTRVSTGYDVLHTALREWGITLYAGVTGGGLVHFLEDLPPHDADLNTTQSPSFFGLGEYVAGFVPLGYFLATGKPAAGVATTGAATKLLACGLSDAKLHDVPSVYIVPVSNRSTYGLAPLQDTSIHGSHIVAQLAAELPDSVFVLDHPETLHTQLTRARAMLLRSKPVVLVLAHDALSRPAVAPSMQVIHPTHPAAATEHDISTFLKSFRDASEGRRIIILAGEELCRHAHVSRLVTRLCEQLRAPIVWSMNGANGVERSNPYGYGYILFGGNEAAARLWASMNDDDVLLVLGACLDEYTINLQTLRLKAAFFVSEIELGYGRINDSFRHRVHGNYHEITAPIDHVLTALLEALDQAPFRNRHEPPAPADLNEKVYPAPADGYVDLVHMYQYLDTWWPSDSIGIDDVCMAYKDRPYITQRPHPNIRFYSFYRGSAMGGAYGAAIGAKLGAPHKHVYVFTGDGCFRLFAGCMSEARHLGIVVFVFNNHQYAIAHQGYRRILPDADPSRYHADLFPLDHAAIARASGWQGYTLHADLSNLHFILEDCLQHPHRSALIDVPVDGHQELGVNPRIGNL
jgi:acetolactate synthase I/II/III large subunit